jgi:hypothetical protein
MKLNLVIAIAFVVGVLLGLYLPHLLLTKGQHSGIVHVRLFEMPGGSHNGSEVDSEVTGEVVGFSCTAANGGPCYILSR